MSMINVRSTERKQACITMYDGSLRNLKKNWNMIYEIISEVLTIVIKPNPLQHLLSIIEDNLLKKQKRVIVYFTTAARITFVQNWKKETDPTYEMVMEKIVEYLEIVRLTAQLREVNTEKYMEEWESV